MRSWHTAKTPAHVRMLVAAGLGPACARLACLQAVQVTGCDMLPKQSRASLAEQRAGRQCQRQVLSCHGEPCNHTQASPTWQCARALCRGGPVRGRGRTLLPLLCAAAALDPHAPALAALLAAPAPGVLLLPLAAGALLALHAGWRRAQRLGCAMRRGGEPAVAAVLAAPTHACGGGLFLAAGAPLLLLMGAAGGGVPGAEQ